MTNNNITSETISVEALAGPLHFSRFQHSGLIARVNDSAYMAN